MAKGGHVRGQFFHGFFEGNADPRFVIKLCATHQEFQAKQCLARARASANQCGTALGKAAVCNLIETTNPCWNFFKGYRSALPQPLLSSLLLCWCSHFVARQSLVARQKDSARDARSLFVSTLLLSMTQHASQRME